MYLLLREYTVEYRERPGDQGGWWREGYRAGRGGGEGWEEEGGVGGEAEEGVEGRDGWEGW